jgi:hypothetical protein
MKLLPKKVISRLLFQAADSAIYSLLRLGHQDQLFVVLKCFLTDS